MDITYSRLYYLSKEAALFEKAFFKRLAEIKSERRSMFISHRKQVLTATPTAETEKQAHVLILLSSHWVATRMDFFSKLNRHYFRINFHIFMSDQHDLVSNR